MRWQPSTGTRSLNGSKQSIILQSTNTYRMVGSVHQIRRGAIGKAVRFENGELTPYEQLEGDTERRTSELDGNLLKEISDEIDRELAELSEEENDEQTTCEYGHEREQGDKEEGDSSSVVKRSPEGIIVSQKDVVKSTINSSRISEPQSALPPEAQETLWRPQSLSLEMGRQALPQGP